MHVSRWILGTVSLAVIAVPASSIARAGRRPDSVGPRLSPFSALCPTRFTEFNGPTAGAQIPIPALRLGEPIRRAATPFTTGGSGTANLAEVLRRKEAGLPYEPVMFDVVSSARPTVYAAETTNDYFYERLPLKTPSAQYDPGALVFAQPTSPAVGLISSLQLTMPKAPANRPKVRVFVGRESSGGCQDQVVDVYAPAMTAEHVRSLFSPSLCNWRRLVACTASQWPRGRVLFVEPADQAGRYTYRWIDYDLLAKARFGKSAK